jgi:hypothetical protein
MRSRFSIEGLVFLGLGALMLGCGATDADDGQLGLENTAVEQSPALQTFFGGYIKATWRQGEPLQSIVSASTHTCWLGRAEGRFVGLGEEVYVQIRNGQWVLGGKSQAAGIKAVAYCVPFTKFNHTTSVTVGTETVTQAQCTLSDCVAGIGDTMWGNTITFLTGIGGKLAGGEEYSEVLQSTTGKSRVRAHTRQELSFVRARANWFWPGFGGLIKFDGPSGLGANASAAGEWALTFQGGTLDLGDASTKICFPTMIGGDFDDEQFFPVYVDVGLVNTGTSLRWHFRADHKAKGRARCVPFSQPL